eukprot:TRINITY_DN9105_c0_g1_i4.p1 TRINITY_DN9105_c0_g1~~TRINITY_DN9105_c0_g1_i4.p1  ORF type:complete len:227 (+),score=18.53 TRINITY_DN9105_c0_g1_i4:60-683(+)
MTAVPRWYKTFEEACVHLARNECDVAANLLQQALNVADSETPLKRHVILARLAACAEKQGDLTKAERYFLLAISSAEKSTQSFAIDVESLLALCDYRLGCARLFSAMKKHEKANDLCSETIAHVAALRRSPAAQQETDKQLLDMFARLHARAQLQLGRSLRRSGQVEPQIALAMDAVNTLDDMKTPVLSYKNMYRCITLIPDNIYTT